jgi:hypothetical protein
MKLSFSFLALWCATTALARPGSTLQQRMERRTSAAFSNIHRGGMSSPVQNLTLPVFHNLNGTASSVFTSNWAGAIITSPPAGTVFDIVVGSFQVPVPSPPVSGVGTWWGTAWVGIDGFTTNPVILQTGIDWGVNVLSDGTRQYGYWGWYEWYPSGWTDFTFTVAGGDTIELVIEAPTLASGMCALRNQRTGQSVSTTVSAPNASEQLVGQNAEWIVEDFSSGGQLVPLAGFGSVVFSNCLAGAGRSVLSVNSTSATTVNIANSTTLQPITTVNFPGTNQVGVTYTGSSA